jgi:hypothetical protein
VLFSSLLFCLVTNAQIKTSVDSTSIKIGQELLLSLEVEVDSAVAVVFPDAKSFGSMEVLESYKIDTTYKDLSLRLIRKYGLTQFDSGTYTIPGQKVLVGDKTFLSDSIIINVLNVKTDTTKQKLFGIKPIIEVANEISIWDKYKLAISLAFICICVALYLFLLRKKTLSEAEKIAALPAYDQALIALDKLNEKTHFEDKSVKDFYSKLTYILRQYLNEKVYDQSLESTTEELLHNLKKIRDSEKIDISDKTLKNIELTLKRADLVKFAKATPGFEIIRMDKQVVAQEIDSVKTGLPEPTDEELEKTLEYQALMLKKKKRKRIKRLSLSTAALVILIFLATGSYFGFKAVIDTVMFNPSKLLLEKKWIYSEYGAPGISLETPVVLERDSDDGVQNNPALKTKVFSLKQKNIPLRIIVKSSKIKSKEDIKEPDEAAQELLKIAESELTYLGEQGAMNMIPKNEQFITDNGQQGLKTFGKTNFIFKDNLVVDAEFVILGFSAKNLVQQLILVWDSQNDYAVKMSDRILSSVELVKLNQE